MTLVRSLAPADHDDWLRLWRGYQAFYKADIPDAVSSTIFARLLDPQEPMHGLVAILDGVTVGLTHWIAHRSCWTEGDYAYLQDLFVEEAARGRKVARRLIEAVYEAAGAAGCARVYWLTHETNRDAMLLYDRIAERSGFIQYRKIIDR